MGGPNTRVWGIVGEEGQARSASQLSIINFRARVILKGQVHTIRATPGIGDWVASLEMASFLAQSKSHGQILGSTNSLEKELGCRLLTCQGDHRQDGQAQRKRWAFEVFSLLPPS